MGQEEATPSAPAPFELPLRSEVVQTGMKVPNSNDAYVLGKLERADAPGLLPGTRALSLFLVNRRAPDDEQKLDRDFLFQVELELSYEPGFVPRPNLQGESASDWDDRVADLQFRERCEYAVGHGISAEVPSGQGERVTRVRTTWLSRQEVRKVATHEDVAIEAGMEKLASLPDGAAVRACLLPLVQTYGAWLKAQASIAVAGDQRRETQRALLQKAEHARQRVRSGIERVASDPVVLEAFRLMNFATLALPAHRRQTPAERRRAASVVQEPRAALRAGRAHVARDDGEDQRSERPPRAAPQP